VELMGLIYRFIFVLLDTANMIYISQNSRLGYSTFGTGLNSLGKLITSLFLSSYKRSQDIYTAMESRCYDGDINLLENNYAFSYKNIFLIVVVEVVLIIISFSRNISWGNYLTTVQKEVVNCSSAGEDIMSKYILETKNLSYKYPDGTKALNNINIKIEKGKKISFVGVNGSGKSTIFLNFNGVLKPTNGTVIYKGNEVKYNQKSLQELRRNVGIVFQDPENQLFSADVYQEVSFGAMNLKLGDAEVRCRVDEALKNVEMQDYKDKAVHFLSYGQKKRVAIADILVMNPEIIVFDEPTSSLDPQHSKQIVKIFDELNEKGITVILSTHDVELAYSWSDYIIVMKDGEIAREGSPYEIFSDDKLIHESYLEKPLILEVFEELRKSGKISTSLTIPRNKKELFKIISESKLK